MTTRTYDPAAIAATLDSGPAPETDPDEIDIDFGSGEAPQFEIIPPGRYLATIFDVRRQFASTGNDMLVLTLRLTDAPYNGRRLTDYYVLTEKAIAFKLRPLLISLGFDAGDLTGPRRFNPKLLLDTDVWVTVKHEEYDGKTREKVGKVEGRQAYQAPTRPDLDEFPF